MNSAHPHLQKQQQQQQQQQNSSSILSGGGGGGGGGGAEQSFKGNVSYFVCSLQEVNSGEVLKFNLPFILLSTVTFPC